MKENQKLPFDALLEWSSFLEAGGEVAPLTFFGKTPNKAPWPVDQHQHFIVAGKSGKRKMKRRIKRRPVMQEGSNRLFRFSKNLKDPWCQVTNTQKVLDEITKQKIVIFGESRTDDSFTQDLQM